ncbi:MAG: DnaJ family domain-containing protein [Anaerobacillus sp.]|uniref:DnaJ family domain-containing protein n=1 Tax=Anaerobacillus sp. TaxID=1872506 RepID=UPI003919A374
MTRDWLGDIINKDDKNEGKLKGMGKPLSREILEGNVLDRTVKNAGYLPQWVALQHEVRDRLHKILPLLEDISSRNKVEEEISSINLLIRKYNSICPAPMQKMVISFEDVKSQINRWQ